MVNDSSYTFDNILPFYEKSVTFTPPNTSARLANATTEYDRTVDTTPGGPVQITYSNYVSSLSTLTQSALERLGFPTIDGFNNGRIIGNSYCTLTISPSDQVRSSSTAYLDRALHLSNLKVYTQTIAQKIIFNNKTATGVQVQSQGIDYTIHASKEVILSAGAFQSPQLLMVSGVGPSDVLNDLGIDIVANLPGVGQNMWDHILFGPSYTANIDTLSAVLKNLTNLISAVEQYATNATGPLTSPGVEFIGWEKVPAKYRANFSQSTIDDLAQFPSDWPEVEVSFTYFLKNDSNTTAANRCKRLHRTIPLPGARSIHTWTSRPAICIYRRKSHSPDFTRKCYNQLYFHDKSTTDQSQLAHDPNRPRSCNCDLPASSRSSQYQSLERCHCGRILSWTWPRYR